MFFLFLIGGVILVRFLAFILSPDRNVSKIVRIIIVNRKSIILYNRNEGKL